jgi:hypothetical protein
MTKNHMQQNPYRFFKHWECFGKHYIISNNYYNHKFDFLSSHIFSPYNNKMKEKNKVKVYIYSL